LAQGEVRLEVPASPEFFRIARIMGAGVASRLGFTLDELEDLSIAIDELCFALVGRGTEGTLCLTYQMLPDRLAVEGVGRFQHQPDTDPTLTDLSAQILDAVLDECEVGVAPSGPRFRMVKRRRVA
jgi:serine/threonine-protein kinase RsbW